ncbi:glycosyltransferase [Rectinema subterraneum]|jgi:glycosyltransferase involved in cell wall biosynthesis|uniref:glycosyltransferase n=1 Tax=Rectinema subterraneum TaxID=2653714 RepID=UPI00131BB84C|nr:glycosyltransferase [Rectinema subterraneum]
MKANNLKIIFFVLGDINIASSRVRVFQLLPSLRKFGIKYKIIKYNNYFINKVLFVKHYHNRSNIIIFKIIDRLLHYYKILYFIIISFFYDICFIQKIVLPILAIKVLTRINNNLVFDIDDALYCNDDGNFIKNYRLNYILKNSKHVFVGNDELYNYASKYCSSVSKIIGPIDCNRYKPSIKINQDEIVTIGWIGSDSTTKYLLSILNILDHLTVKHENLRIIAIGAKNEKIFRGIKIEIINWSLKTELYYLSKFDIGIMPLIDDLWTKGKGGYKILQYMAIGIPVVASSVGINKYLIRNGYNGFLASNEIEWTEKLEYLILNKDKRIDMGKRGRIIANNNYSIEKSISEMLEVFNNLKHDIY